MASEDVKVYVFESDKERSFRMERRKFYRQNKKVVEEVLQIGKDKQVKAGYRRNVHLHQDLHKHIWQDIAKEKELICVVGLYALEDGPQVLYNFTGEFGTPSTIVGGTEDSEIENLETLVKEIKHTLQSDILYGATCKPWFYTLKKQEIVASAEEITKAQQNFVQNIKDNPAVLDFLNNLAENDEQRQALAETLKAPLPETHDLVMRGLTPEERNKFSMIYDSQPRNK